MSNRFNRRVRITLASRLGSVTHDSTGRFFNAFSQKTTVEDLRVAFTIVKSLSKDANSAKITINNMAEATRGEFEALPAHITLEAGHVGDIRQVYKGDLVDATSRREGTEWLTEVQAGTGATAIKHARINKSFKVGGNIRDMIKDVADSMGLKVPKSASEAKEFLTTVSNGIALSGPSMEQMQRLVKPHGYTASIQDDQLVILSAKGVRQVQAVVISQETGMIGSPTLGTPENKGDPPTLSARMLLAPDLLPGGLVSVKSLRINGNFKVVQVTHTGDTHGQPWYSDVEAIPL